MAFIDMIQRITKTQFNSVEKPQSEAIHWWIHVPVGEYSYHNLDFTSAKTIIRWLWSIWFKESPRPYSILLKSPKAERFNDEFLRLCENSYHNLDFIPAKGIIRWLRSIWFKESTRSYSILLKSLEAKRFNDESLKQCENSFAYRDAQWSQSEEWHRSLVLSSISSSRRRRSDPV